MPSGRCPYCKKDSVFTVLAQYPPQGHTSPSGKPIHQGSKNGVITLAKCGHTECQAIVYRESHPNHDELQWDIYPPVELEAEEELKDPVKKSYQEALNVFADGHWTAAVQALGRTLHDATAQLQPEGVQKEDWLKKKSYHRIEDLGKTGIIPESMKQWLHEIRQSRIWATHWDEYADWWAEASDALEALELHKMVSAIYV